MHPQSPDLWSRAERNSTTPAKKHGGSRATFTDEHVLFQIMPGKAHEQVIVFLQQNFVRAMEAANCPMTKTTVGIGATISKGQFYGKEPDWGIRPIGELRVIVVITFPLSKL